MTRRTFPILLFTLMAPALHAVEVQDGDIVFQRSQSRQSEAIAAATGSDHTHVGVVFLTDGRPFVYEAVQPVRRIPLDEWIRRGAGGTFAVKRLRAPSNIDFTAVHRHARAFLGRAYDGSFGWSDERIYCSELVWKAYQRGAGIELGPLKRLRDFDLRPPVVRRMLEERYGDAIPLDMQVISPACIYASELLITVPQDR